ncbi:MAG TPA: hypothetical protein VNH11_14405 [Pirellulales bacterium]|nr:hypothetical protein [Pirellulales bacterium]
MALRYHFPRGCLPPGLEPEFLAARLKIERQPSISDVIHCLHAFRACPQRLDEVMGASFDELKSVLLDQNVAEHRYNGSITIVRTSHGLKYVTATTVQAIDASAQATAPRHAVVRVVGTPQIMSTAAASGTITPSDISRTVESNLAARSN